MDCGYAPSSTYPGTPIQASSCSTASLDARARLAQRSAVARELLHRGVAMTPVLFIDRAMLHANVAQWHARLPDVHPFYAVKANGDPLVLAELFAQGVDADVASAHEIDMARAMGLTGDRMILSNPRRDPATIRTMKVTRVWAAVIDSAEEISKLVQAGVPGDDYNPVLFVRIKVPAEGDAEGLNSKFGVRVLPPSATFPSDRAHLLPGLDHVRALLRLAHQAGFTRLGLAFHVGTQCANARAHECALALVRHVAERCRADGLPVHYLDIGGGFPDERVVARTHAHAAGDPRADLLSAVGKAAADATAAGFTVIAEPGRYFVADAGYLVTRVTYVGTSRSAIQIDDGLYHTLSGRIHDDRDYQFHALPVEAHRAQTRGETFPMTVWGCSCDSFDRVADAAAIPADIAVGDALLVECLGAYSTSFGSHTNGFAPAAVVLYHYEGDRLHATRSPLAEQVSLLVQHTTAWAARART